jgi:hypothetical protein
MQTQKERLTNLMDSALGKIKLNDRVKGEASGPQLVASVDPNGQQGLAVGWQLTVWLEHNVLLGQDPVGVTVPVGMMLPPADAVAQITSRLLEEARKIRHAASGPSSPNGLPSMDQVLGKLKEK